MSSIAVLYGTTADDNVRPVLCNDSGQLVTDQSGGTNWYENLYIGGTDGNPFISLLSNGTIQANNSCFFEKISATGGNGYGLFYGYSDSGAANEVFSVENDGTVTTKADVYCNKLHQADGYDLSKIGQALSTIHDVVESVDDLQGLKNLFHLLLDNLKSPYDPPTPPVTDPSE